MLTVADIIRHLAKASVWQDGESLVSVSQRLTAEQLAGPGRLILRISERGDWPGFYGPVCYRTRNSFLKCKGVFLSTSPMTTSSPWSMSGSG